MIKISCYTGGIAETNGYLVETPQGKFAVDAPEGMTAWLDAQGAKVATLLLTHQHFDHCQDAAAMQSGHGARVLAFSAFSRELTLEFLMGFVSGTRFQVEAFKVDEILEGQTEVEVAGLKWQLAHIPGHSLDSVTFYSEENGLVFGGDVLFAGSIGRCDFPGGSQQLLVQGIQKHLLNLPELTRVIPGHGPETTIGDEKSDNPYLEG
jgi:hydroxyacylglutathione hydrolase